MRGPHHEIDLGHVVAALSADIHRRFRSDAGIELRAAQVAATERRAAPRRSVRNCSADPYDEVI
jgi:hypothetical protein